MALRIDTFDNVRGGNTLYKALTHPHAAAGGRAIVKALARCGPAAIVDPLGAAAAFAEIFPLRSVDIAGVFVQDVARIGEELLGHQARPVTDLAGSNAASILIAAFDAERLQQQLGPFLPVGASTLGLDAMRIPDERLSNPRRYLDPLNFATNFAFFRDSGALHTRIVTANYWAGYGASEVTCWLTLFDGDGAVLADWSQHCGAGAIVIDSGDVRARFGLGDFAGQLFLHVAGATGHDVVKYALDTYGEAGSGMGAVDGALSCTHDANAWPADRYAGLPAPAPGERVILWVQNSHPTPIPPGALALNPMGEERLAALPQAIPAFASCAVDVAELLPGLAWPRQIELRAGKHVVRPRYEIVGPGADQRRRIAHVNVERSDLAPDPALPRLGAMLGKGHLLPAPILPRATWESLVLPTPMALSQQELPIAALVYDPEGREIARAPLGRLPRDHATALALDPLAAGLGEGYGHVELVYDFAEGGSGDGWLHALFRYCHRESGHAAETSFGSHVFNTILVHRDEPQSYAGPPPGLSTRLFLRLGPEPYDTLCHLIYPASRPWHPTSATEIILYDGDGREAAREAVAIPCSGSVLLRYHALFGKAARARAGCRAYAIVRDPTCRLFGYHGLLGTGGAFSLDHMFGF